MPATLSFDFSGQAAVVTGGTRGIGGAVSQMLLDAGARVVATYAGNTERAEAFRKQCGEAGERLELACFDVADYDAVERFYEQFDDDHSRLDILVANAGVRRDNVVGMMAREDWERVIDVNLTGTYTMAKFAVQRMSGARHGRIVCITSPSGRMGFRGQANYAASKAGQVAFIKSLSKEVARRKITVNAVSPGFTETDLIADLPPDQATAYKKTIPMARFGKPEEVAAAVCMLASDQAGYITGTTLEVTGGL